MSILNQLFNRGVFGTKCKTCLNLSISRIKLLQNKRDLQLKQMRKEIAQFLQAGQEPIARIRVEHVIREQNIWAAYEILELFCEFILARVPIIEMERECPLELREAIASIIFAAPRCSDVSDLLHVKNLFSTKYGKEFIASASDLRPDSSVNRTVIEKLSVNAPSPESKLNVLKAIAREYNLKWDSTETEEEFSKRHEDLLGGASQIGKEAGNSRITSNQGCFQSSPSNGARHLMHVDTRQQGYQQLEAPSPPKTTFSSISGEMPGTASNNDHVVPVCDSNSETRSQSSDILEKARAAIAAAERATAAARAAAALAQINFRSIKLEEGKS